MASLFCFLVTSIRHLKHRRRFLINNTSTSVICRSSRPNDRLSFEECCCLLGSRFTHSATRTCLLARFRFAMLSPSQAPDNLIDGFYRTTCNDDPPSKASSSLVPRPQRELVRIAIDHGEPFFMARRPKQIDTFLNTVARKRRTRGGKRAGPLIFLEELVPSAPAPSRRRRLTAAQSWPWLLLASCAVLLGRSLACCAAHAGGNARSSAAAAAGWSAAAGWPATPALGPWVWPRPSPVQGMFTSGGTHSAAVRAAAGGLALERTGPRGRARSASPRAARRERRGLARMTGEATGASRGSARVGAIDVASFALPVLMLVCCFAASLGSVTSPLASALLRASRLTLNVPVCAGWPTWVAYAARAGFSRFGSGVELVLRWL